MKTEVLCVDVLQSFLWFLWDTAESGNLDSSFCSTSTSSERVDTIYTIYLILLFFWNTNHKYSLHFTVFSPLLQDWKILVCWDSVFTALTLYLAHSSIIYRINEFFPPVNWGSWTKLPMSFLSLGFCTTDDFTLN